MNTLTKTQLVRCYTVDKLISNLSDNFINKNLDAIPQAIEARKIFLSLSYSNQLIESYLTDSNNVFKAKVNAISTLNSDERLELFQWIKQAFKQEDEKLKLLIQKYNLAM